VLKFIVRRVVIAIPALLGLSVVIFMFIHILPGDPCATILGDHETPQSCQLLRTSLGLDLPLWRQYVDYLGRLLHGDFGYSVFNNKPVLSEFAIRFPATIELALAALLFAVGAGIPLGRFAAHHAQTWGDAGATVVSLFGVSIPVFVTGLVLAYVFGVMLGWLPTQGQLDPHTILTPTTNFVLIDAIVAGRPDVFVEGLSHLVLPAIALGSVPFAVITRITRASVLEVLNEDYVRTARAKGLAERRIDSRHVMRNAWGPVITVVGLQVGTLLSGAVLTETVFSWPGVGRWVVTAIQARDYFVVQGAILIFAMIFLTVNLVVDVAYAFVNPRIRYS
jgi:ABC-type dipeptide/oligopeptide/nickel transport system permease component